MNIQLTPTKIMWVSPEPNTCINWSRKYIHWCSFLPIQLLIGWKSKNWSMGEQSFWDREAFLSLGMFVKSVLTFDKPWSLRVCWSMEHCANDFIKLNLFQLLFSAPLYRAWGVVTFRKAAGRVAGSAVDFKRVARFQRLLCQLFSFQFGSCFHCNHY